MLLLLLKPLSPSHLLTNPKASYPFHHKHFFRAFDFKPHASISCYSSLFLSTTRRGTFLNSRRVHPSLPIISKLLFWNARGLNSMDKHRPLTFWLQAQQPLFGALLETHIKEMNMNQIMASTCPGWNFS